MSRIATDICELCHDEFVDGRGAVLDDNSIICEHCYDDYEDVVKECTLKEFVKCKEGY